MRRTSRRLVAIITLFGLLVVHGAVAAHACALMQSPAGALVTAVSPRAVDGDCTADMDQADAAVCLHHCSQGHDANSTGNAADVPGPVLMACLTVAAAPPRLTSSRRAATPINARTTSPPPLLLSQRLRI